MIRITKKNYRNYYSFTNPVTATNDLTLKPLAKTEGPLPKSTLIFIQVLTIASGFLI